MPKTDSQAHLSTETVRAVMAVARTREPLAFALTAWMYEFGARVSEPGLQLLSDVDLRTGRARPVHLKSGAAKTPQPLLPFCREALPLWIAVRPAHILKPEQKNYLFPSKRPGRCYTCKGTGQRTELKRVGKRRIPGEKLACHHCNETGERWGIDRAAVYPIVHEILKAAGCKSGYWHPHVLRHSIITHLLDKNIPVTAIQRRVGHLDASTTLAYGALTQRALSELETALDDVYEDDETEN